MYVWTVTWHGGVSHPSTWEAKAGDLFSLVYVDTVLHKGMGERGYSCLFIKAQKTATVVTSGDSNRGQEWSPTLYCWNWEQVDNLCPK